MPKLEFLNYEFFISKKNKYLQLVIILRALYLISCLHLIWILYIRCISHQNSYTKVQEITRDDDAREIATNN